MQRLHVAVNRQGRLHHINLGANAPRKNRGKVFLEGGLEVEVKYYSLAFLIYCIIYQNAEL